MVELFNLFVVVIVNDLGVDKVFEVGEKFGFNMEKVDCVFGVVLGSGVEINFF